ncbi:MAG: sulfatase-like hydrolase/transferase [Gammaproteobacteria bacterium]|nr:sulfatase-like hydrolase/transferase [Gammaproteobacteria bacterium]
MKEPVLATISNSATHKTMALYLLLLIFSTLAAEAKDTQPNILFIVADNQPASILSAYGNPDVRTPNIDRLANEGLRFTRAYAVHGMCSPTRATLLTGLLPSQHGVQDWLDDEEMSSWPDDWNAIREYRTLPHTLKNRGYQTSLIGKWHLGQPQPPGELFDYWVTFNLGHTVDFWDNEINDNSRKYKLEDQHSVDFFSDKAVAYLESYDHQKPFFLMVTYNGPYMNPPTNLGAARNRHYASYENKEFPSFPRNRVNETVLEEAMVPDPEEWYLNLARMHNDPETMANAASQNTLVDDGVGRLLEALKANGLAENTLIIYTSDQGNFFGQHGLWGHTDFSFPASMYETAMNIPLIAHYPGVIEKDQTSDLFIGQYDLMPTILEMAGISVEIPNSPGRSFAEHLKGEALKSWGDAVYMDQEATRVIRTRQYSYWKRMKGTGQHKLYDMQKDPGQEHNLFGKHEYAEVVSELDRRLTQFFNTWTNAEYDLWRGGTVKGSTESTEVYRSLYGKQWKPETEIKPAFKEDTL